MSDDLKTKTEGVKAKFNTATAAITALILAIWETANTIIAVLSGKIQEATNPLSELLRALGML